MIKKLAFTGIGLALLASPIIASAQSADIQAQIAALQAQVKQLLALIAQLQGQTSTSCVNLYTNMTLGSNSPDVMSLQDYLIKKGYLGASYNTGYYGFLTAQAVGKMQVAMSIVSSNTDTAYGILGPKTRSAIGCGTVSLIPIGNLSATPTSGAAPLEVRFAVKSSLTAPHTAIIFGDDQATELGINAAGDEGCNAAGNDSVCSVTHTYSSAGVYTAKLLKNYCTGACDFSANQVVGTATVTVTGGNSTQASASIDQNSLTTTSGNPLLQGQLTISTNLN